jgi:hypothetical protein
MSKERPTVAADLIASLIAATPERVRRRLDSSPNAAASWNWQASEQAWSVAAGGETVTLPHGHLVRVEQLTCTCLLSPRCFHVLACLTGLQVALTESMAAAPNEPVSASSTAAEEDHVVPEESQRHAARDLVNCVNQLLRVGVANAGVVVQSGLLRAVHQCRADGLHRLAALGLRILAGIHEFRTRAPALDPAQLAEDLADVLETSRHVLSLQPIAGFWIGTARRRQLPVRPRKLHGLFAEPLVTRSGYSGAAVYFLGEDDRIYTAADVRPGDAQHARDAYLGGIDIGPMIQSAKQLARGLYVGTDLIASADGRLGRGKGVKLVAQGPSTWQSEAIQQRFQRPLGDHWNAAYAPAALPADARPAGWDFVFLAGTVLGALGPDLLFQPMLGSQPIRLAIANETEPLNFRENLRMLSHAPGLRLQLIGRLNLNEPGIVFPLAAAVAEAAGAEEEPRLELPNSWAGRICLGFDEMQSHFFRNARTTPLVLSLLGLQAEQEEVLSGLRRRWLAMLLAGLACQGPSNTKLLTAEIAALNHRGWKTGAALLSALASAATEQGSTGTDMFLATALYLRASNYEFAKASVALA